MGLLARTHHSTHAHAHAHSLDGAISSSFGARAESFFRLALLTLVLHLGKNTLVKQQVGAGGQHLLQAGLADGVVRNPQPLVAGGERVLGRRRGPSVGHEVSRVHVSVVDNNCHQLEEVRGGAER